MPRLRDDEAGFTLIEMMIAAVIMAAIVAPLTASVLLGLLTVTQSKSRVTHSTDEALMTSYFVTDVQSSSSVATGSYCSGGGALLVLNWTVPQSSEVRQVAYIQDGNTLVRVACSNGVESRRLTVSRQLLPATPPVFACALTTSFSAPCTEAQPAQVRASISQAGDSFQADDYSFELTTARRVGI